MTWDKEKLAKQMDDVHRWTGELYARSTADGPASAIRGWTTIQPTIPPGPYEESEVVAYWKVRQDQGQNMVMCVYHLDDRFFGSLIFRADSGTLHASYSKFEVRDGRLWGRTGPGMPYDLETTGWEYDGEVIFSID